ncbi:armadillo-type protein [Mycena epipterygia]|nr:armadillo-type protein [Mycena epipterygia]
MPPPLQRFNSIHSWWSNSNMNGATINLNIIASPLARAFHRWNVVALIKKHKPARLSQTIIDDFLDYLLANEEIPPSTKCLILTDLEARAASSFADAQAMMDPNLLPILFQLLDSPQSDIRRGTCLILARIAEHKHLTEAVVDAKVIMALRSHMSPIVQRNMSDFVEWEILCVLRPIAIMEAGAQKLVEANLLSDFIDLINSPHRSVQNFSCFVLAEMSSHHSEGLMQTIVDGNVLVRVRSLLQSTYLNNPNAQLAELAALYTLTSISVVKGPQVIVGADFVPVLLRLLESRDRYCVQSASSMLLRLAESGLMMSDQLPDVRFTICQAIFNVNVVPTLIDLLIHSSATTDELGYPQIYPRVNALLRSRHVFKRKESEALHILADILQYPHLGGVELRLGLTIQKVKQSNPLELHDDGDPTRVISSCFEDPIIQLPSLPALFDIRHVQFACVALVAICDRRTLRNTTALDALMNSLWGRLLK